MIEKQNEPELKPYRGYRGKCGYYRMVDNTFCEVIPCRWQEADEFHEGLALVRDENGIYGFINSSGLVVIPCKWAEPCLFFEDMAMVKDDNDKYGYIDKMGNIVIPCSGKSVSVSGAAREQGKRYGQTGSETAYLSIRTYARTN